MALTWWTSMRWCWRSSWWSTTWACWTSMRCQWKTRPRWSKAVPRRSKGRHLWREVTLPLVIYQAILGLKLQLAKSSRAIHGGAYFSAVCGRKLIPINAPGPYECQECNRLLFSPPGATFFLPYIHMYIGSAALRAFQMDLCWSRSHGFVCLTNPRDLLQHKSIWNAHRAAEAVCMWM